MQCEVHDKLGNHCPNEVSHKFQFRDKEVHLCGQCFANVCSGAYEPGGRKKNEEEIPNRVLATGLETIRSMAPAIEGPK